MKKIVVGASSFAKASDAPLKYLQEQGYEVCLNPYGRKLTREETKEFLKDADGILAGLEPLDRDVLESCKGKLKAIARIGIGMDNVDQEAAREFGIAVSNTPDGPTKAVTEMTLAAALALCRGLIRANTALHEGKWEKRISSSLEDAVVLLIGYGRIGQNVAKAFSNMGAKILVYDPAFPDISVATLEKGLKKADIVSLHASGKEKILGKKELSFMKDGAFLLNSARGELVDEDALFEALNSGKLGGCWLDVFAKEPYEGKLSELPNAILTPHISTYTKQCREGMEMEAAKNIVKDLGQSD